MLQAAESARPDDAGSALENAKVTELLGRLRLQAGRALVLHAGRASADDVLALLESVVKLADETYTILDKRR